MAYELANDPYVDPATGVMRNRHGNEDNARVAAEGWVTEAQTKAGACQIVQQRRRGYTRNILAVEAEGFDDGIAQGRCFLTDRLAEALGHRPLLIPPEGVLKERRQQPRPKQRPTQLA